MIDLKKELSNHLRARPTETGWTVEVQLPPELSYFRGHFPQNPILPAVAIVDISLHALEKVLNQKKIRLQGLPSLKVRTPMTAHEKYQVEIHSPQENRWSFLWRKLNPDEKVQDQVSADLEIITLQE